MTMYTAFEVGNQSDLLNALSETVRNDGVLIVYDDGVKAEIKKLTQEPIRILTLVEVFLICSISEDDLLSKSATLLMGHMTLKDNPVATIPITTRIEKEENAPYSEHLKSKVSTQLKNELQQLVQDGDIYIKDNQILAKKTFRDFSEYLYCLGAPVNSKTFYLKLSAMEVVKSFKSITVVTPKANCLFNERQFKGVQPIAGNLETNRWRLVDILTQAKHEREKRNLVKLSVFYESETSLDMLRALSRDWISIKHYRELMNDNADVRVFIEPPSSAQSLSYYLMLSRETDHSLWVLPSSENGGHYKKMLLSGDSGVKLVSQITALLSGGEAVDRETQKRTKGFLDKKESVNYVGLMTREFSEKTDIITKALGNN